MKNMKTWLVIPDKWDHCAFLPPSIRVEAESADEAVKIALSSPDIWSEELGAVALDEEQVNLS